MGEYKRLNTMLREKEKQYAILEKKEDKTEEEFEIQMDLWQSIGEIKGALLEMAYMDGLEDVNEAFDY